MKTIGDTLDPFSLIATKPFFNQPNQEGESAFETITQDSFSGYWKVFYFYPKNFTGVCASEIQIFNLSINEFTKRKAILMACNTESEYSHLAWRREEKTLHDFSHYSLSDPSGELIDQLGIRDSKAKVALRATVIVNPEGIIEHISLLPLRCGRSVKEVIRILDALQSDKPTLCERLANPIS